AALREAWHRSRFKAGISVRCGFSLLILALSFTSHVARAQAVIEGTVQLPKASADRGVNQRYQANADIPLAPTNPPAAVVYLEGNFHLPQTDISKTQARMSQKNIAFAPDLLPVLVGTAVDFPNQ